MLDIKLFFSSAALACLSACGGGGGVGSAITPVSLSGSVSQGAAIVGATVTLIDAKGTVIDGGVSGSDGSYSISDISSLTAPILVSAKATVGGTPISYRSILAQKSSLNTANVTPLTDAILTQTVGKSSALIEASASTELANIDLTKLSTTTSKFVKSVSNVLEQITPGTSLTFNPFTTAFVANGEAAADKVNDLVRVTSTITSSGVETDITDKSNTVGTVTISDGTNTTALGNLPQGVLDVNPKYLNDLIANSNRVFASASILDSQAFADGFADDYLDNGYDKAAQIALFRSTYRSFLLGATFSNPKLVSCDANRVCQVKMSLKNITPAKTINTVIDGYYKYDLTKKAFVSFGNHFPYRAEFGTSLIKNTDAQGNKTIYSQIQFTINRDGPDWTKYKSATVTLQSGSSNPDLSYNFLLKPNDCNATVNRYYDGMPFDDGTNSCADWKQFDSNNQTQIKAINDKIKLGNYTAKFQAWTNANRTGTPDVVIVPITDPILTTDRLGEDGFPRVTIVQATGTTLPYLSIDNADDFVVSGSLCITSANYCDTNLLTPLPHTTLTNPDGYVKLPSKIQALSTDGWQVGEKAKGYFIHVQDKAGRDIMVSKYNF